MAKNLMGSSSSQRIDHLRIASVPGCFDSIVKNVKTIVKYGFWVDHANGKVFCEIPPLLPAIKVILFAVPVTKVKYILSKVLLQCQVNNRRIK